MRIAAGYSDPFEPTRPISQGEQDLAAFTLFAPGGNSGMAHYGDEGLDALRNAGHMPRNSGDAIMQDLLEQQGMRERRNLPGVRPGSPGHPDHGAKILQLEQQAWLEARPGEEVLTQRRIRNQNSSRIPDVQIIDASGRTRKVFEAERFPNRTRNLNREAEYRRLGIPYETHPLD